ncbi:MAG: hypothetical protein JSV52_05425 [Candidatus Zixiibacteriota bacterium]|nr:MAG: hypothetical protein JSV52_05425 [candidate division Zixibacteria bacterium]
MLSSCIIRLFCFLLVGSVICARASSREVYLPFCDKTTYTETSSDIPEYMFAQHNVGNMNLVVTNFGFWGFGWYQWHDEFSDEPVTKGSEYPKGSFIFQLQSSEFWFGGIVGRDTLVTMPFTYRTWPWEFTPSPNAFGSMDVRPIGEPGVPGFKPALSNQDIIAAYNDTAASRWESPDFLRGTPHQPLNVEVTQKSYAWSHGLADDFVMFDMTIENIGLETIKEAYFGIMTRPSVGLILGEDHTFDFGHRSMCGFVDTFPSFFGCGIVDTLNMMWGANTDGDPVDGAFTDVLTFAPNNPYEWVKSATSVHGIFFLDSPPTSSGYPPTLSYNWWGPELATELDFGPRHRDDQRDFMTGGLGFPLGDANAYHVMSNGEIDYDLIRTASIGYLDPVWLPPPGEFAMLASSEGLMAPFHLLSVGPFRLEPGQRLNIPWVFACAEDFHTDPANGQNLPSNPDLFYSKLDFSSLARNATWARWIYDNPGVDTDGDRYKGEFVECDGDTIYYTGDGIPDWRGAVPPPAPKVWLEPAVNSIRVRFNGDKAETERDVFTKEIEFEGYRVYCGLDSRATSLALVASYDKLDFNKYEWSGDTTELKYELNEIPFTLDSLRCLYGLGTDPCADSTFDPLIYTPTSPYIHPDFPDSLFYFVPCDHNTSALGESTPIVKVYPDEADPSVYHPDSIPEDAYTPEGFLKYYEYELTIDNLLPTIPYSINVTAFDFGQPELRIPPMETSVTVGVQSVYPMGALEATEEGAGEVYVYPNPYRGDVDYRKLGFEGRMQEDRPDHRVRAINFANLPPRCNIYIYSIDGDLIRKLVHDMDPSDPNHRHHTWNMITRNTQMVVSGLYYWLVEAEDGTTQMGKLVIIL